ncbi:MAG: hypothetical protein V4793_13570, partial [Paraburkholderia tropica]
MLKDEHLAADEVILHTKPDTRIAQSSTGRRSALRRISGALGNLDLCHDNLLGKTRFRNPTGAASEADGEITA